MTVIAWDGVTLAADKRALDNSVVRTTTKIRRATNGALVGTTGSCARGRELFAWYDAGGVPKDFPPSEREHDKCASMVVIETKERGGPTINFYDGGPYPVVFEDRIYAMGSGRDYAQTMMHLGHTARRAVEVACELDPGCGNGVDELTL